jgi:hypothetical protein
MYREKPTDYVQIIRLESPQASLDTCYHEVFIQYMILFHGTVLPALCDDAVRFTREFIPKSVEALPEDDFRRVIMRCGVESGNSVSQSQAGHAKIFRGSIGEDFVAIDFAKCTPTHHQRRHLELRRRLNVRRAHKFSAGTLLDRARPTSR